MTLPPFQFVLDEYAEALHRHVWALVGPDEADDATQEVLIAALRAYPELRHTRNLRGWLWTIARNVAIDRYRHRQRRPQTTPLSDDEAGLSTPADPGETPEDQVAGGEEDELWVAVRGLPEGQRVAVALRFADDLSYREIADLLDCSEGAARQRVHEALVFLRQAFTEVPT